MNRNLLHCECSAFPVKLHPRFSIYGMENDMFELEDDTSKTAKVMSPVHNGVVISHPELKCPRCGATKKYLKIKKSKPTSEGRFRKYICKKCHLNFKTLDKDDK